MRFGAAFKAVAGPALGLAVGAATISFLKDSVAEAREAQKVGAQVNAVIKSTGGVAGVSAKAVDQLANAISRKTGIDDEQISSAQAMLLTFTNVRNAQGVFSSATKAAIDLGVATKTGPVQAATLLGKALNDPAKGLSRLTRVGVTFTDQQKAQVAAMVKSGDTAGAQKVILEELNKEFGGSAKAQATAGEKASVAFKNLKEQIGTALLPVIDRLANAITTQVIPAISRFVTYLQSNKKSINDTFLSLQAVVARVMPFITQFIGNALRIIGGVIKVFAGILNGDWSQVWDGVKQIVRGAADQVKTIISGLISVLKALLSKLGSAIGSLASAAFGRLRSAASNAVGSVLSYMGSLPGKLKGAIKGAGSVLKGVGSSIVEGLLSGIRNAWHTVTSYLSSRISALSGAAKKLLHINSPSKVFAEIGSSIGEGMAVGIDKSGRMPLKSVADMTSSLSSSVRLPGSSMLSAETSAASAGGAGGPFSLRDFESTQRRALNGVVLQLLPNGNARLQTAGA